MKPLPPNPILKLSYFSFRIAKYTHQFSFFSTTSESNSRKKKEDDKTSSVRVSVWWDLENCGVSNNANVFRVAHCITNAVRAVGINGPVHITAFADVITIPRAHQEALASTGITLSHVPNCGKNSADRSLIMDLMYWVSQNPPPAHIFLISGDRDFASILHRLRMNNYNVLLASRDLPPTVLCSAATVMWRWCSLLKGENLSGRLLNQPPDGPYGSWYGKYRGSPEDPFAVSEQCSLLPSPELASDSKPRKIPKLVEDPFAASEQTSLSPLHELASDSEPRKIPKPVEDHIRQILNSHPQGISGTQIREQMKKCDLSVDKNLYGYQKFTRFLSAMPHILKLIPGRSGQFLVVASDSKLHADPVPDMNVPIVYNREVGVQSIPQPSSGNDVIGKSEEVLLLESKANSLTELLLDSKKKKKQKEPSPANNMRAFRVEAHATKEREKNESSQALDVKDTKQKCGVDVKEVRQEAKSKESLTEVPSFGDKEISEARDDSVAADKEQKIGFSKKIKMWFGLEDMNSSDIIISTRGDDIEGKNNPLSLHGESIPPLSVPSDHGSNSCLESDTEVRYNSGEAGQVKDDSKQPKVFSKKFFWDELESFLNKPEDSSLIFQSTTRKQLAQNLKEKGPLSLRSLPKSNLLHLVDLLISDTKWIEESYSQNLPFRLRESSVKEPHGDTTSGSNGLNDSEKPSLGERKRQNPADNGVPKPVVHKNHSKKTRSEILKDCEKLVNHITEKYTEGVKVKSFRKLFFEQHGYPLKIQELGYNNLANLLRTIPGLKVKSNLIVPVGISNSQAAAKSDDSDGEVLNSSKIEIAEDYLDRNSLGKDIDINSSWEELGPVDDSGFKNDETGAGFSGESSKLDLENKIPNHEPIAEDLKKKITDLEPLAEELEKKIPDFEPLPEDDSSGSDEETRTVAADDGSLFEILHMLDRSGEGKEKMSDSLMSEDVDHWTSEMRKQKASGKIYTFVADHSAGAKDPPKMLGGILGTLKLKTEKKE